MHRRTFLRSALTGTTAVLGGSLWRALAASEESGASALTAASAPARPAAAPRPFRPTRTARTSAVLPPRYGPLRRPDANGIRLPAGFTSRVVARSGDRVPGTRYTWHGAPDGGACFPDGRGWIYVSNSEVSRTGGVGALRFGADGEVVDAYRILAGTNRNCAGGATPWNTWLSCEEVAGGYVYETYPQGGVRAVRRPAMGRFKHEAAAVDPIRRCVYLTEDQPDGCFYRFIPTAWPDLSRGTLEVLQGGAGFVPATWARVPDPGATSTPTRRQVVGARRFDGGEGCVYGAGAVWFTTKGDNRVWQLNTATNILSLAYDRGLVTGRAPLRGLDNIARSAAGDLLVAEDGDNMEICLITPTGLVTEFLRILGHARSEIAGPAFSPDGTRLYFSSQRGTAGFGGGGITYEVRGTFGG